MKCSSDLGGHIHYNEEQTSYNRRDFTLPEKQERMKVPSKNLPGLPTSVFYPNWFLQSIFNANSSLQRRARKMPILWNINKSALVEDSTLKILLNFEANFFPKMLLTLPKGTRNPGINYFIHQHTYGNNINIYTKIEFKQSSKST